MGFASIDSGASGASSPREDAREGSGSVGALEARSGRRGGRSLDFTGSRELGKIERPSLSPPHLPVSRSPNPSRAEAPATAARKANAQGRAEHSSPSALAPAEPGYLCSSTAFGASPSVTVKRWPAGSLKDCVVSA